MLDIIGKRVAEDVNWPILIYISFSMVIVIVIVKFADVSFTEIVASIAREFSNFSQNPISRGSLNAAGLVFIFVFLCLYLLLDRVKVVIELLAAAEQKSHGAPTFEFWMGMAALMIFALFSVLSVRDRP